jgi:hypothetical protein
MPSPVGLTSIACAKKVLVRKGRSPGAKPVVLGHDEIGGDMSEDKLQESIARGARAEALLKNDLLQEAFARLERDYLEAWKISPARDTDGRERLWQAVNIVAKVRDHIVKVVNDGKLSQRHLNELARSPPKGR